MVFGGGILGGMRKIWGNPYLNSTTVLFDNPAAKQVCSPKKAVVRKDEGDSHSRVMAKPLIIMIHC